MSRESGEHMPLTDKQRRHLERRLREERAQIVRILDRYHDEQSATERERAGDVSTFPTHPADEGTDTYDAEVEGSLAARATEELHEIDAALERLHRNPERLGCASERVSRFRSRGSTASRGRGPAIRSGAPTDSLEKDFPRNARRVRARAAEPHAHARGEGGSVRPRPTPHWSRDSYRCSHP